MDKYIDADLMALNESEAYMSAQAKIEDPILFGLNSVVHSKIQKLIAETPAVDAVEVVRCKYCIKRYDTDECPMCFLIKGKYYEYTNGNGFCDRGERKEGVTNG